LSPGSVNEKTKDTIFSYFHLHHSQAVPATISLSGQQLYHIESLHPRVHATTATTSMDMIKGTFCTIVLHDFSQSVQQTNKRIAAQGAAETRCGCDSDPSVLPVRNAGTVLYM